MATLKFKNPETNQWEEIGGILAQSQTISWDAESGFGWWGLPSEGGTAFMLPEESTIYGCIGTLITDASVSKYFTVTVNLRKPNNGYVACDYTISKGAEDPGLSIHPDGLLLTIFYK